MKARNGNSVWASHAGEGDSAARAFAAVPKAPTNRKLKLEFEEQQGHASDPLIRGLQASISID